MPTVLAGARIKMAEIALEYKTHAQRVLKGMAYPRSYTVVGDMTVDIEHVTTCKDDIKVHMKYTLNMADLTGDEILLHAAKNCNIAWIRKGLFRETNSTDVMEMSNTAVNAADYRPTRKARKIVDPFQAIMDMVKSGTMTKEDAIANLNAME